MDYDNDRGPSWKVYNHQREPHFSDLPDCTMSEVALNQEDHSYTFDDDETTTTTPVKACEELAYHMTAGDTNKTLEEQKETRSVHKRRRMLQFEDQPAGSSLFSGGNLSATLKENVQVREDPFDEILPEGAHLITGFSDDASPSSFEGLDLHSEEWFSECFNDAETPPFIPDDLSLTGLSDLQIDISEYLNVPPEIDANEIQQQQHVTRSSPNVVFKGRKSFVRPTSRLPSSIVYPFAFIKPCGAHGDITLKDINQRIRTPPAKPKQDKEDPPVYQTSAFSGKPVVGKTKIRTEGGKGSITIMRTKG